MDSIGNLALAGQYQPKYGMLIEGDYYIKVNLPDSADSERTCNGEGVWVIVDEDTCRKYDDNHVGGGFHGELANDSIYYIGLMCGADIPFNMNGEYRPTVSFEWLTSNYGECQW